MKDGRKQILVIYYFLICKINKLRKIDVHNNTQLIAETEHWRIENKVELCLWKEGSKLRSNEKNFSICFWRALWLCGCFSSWEIFQKFFRSWEVWHLTKGIIDGPKNSQVCTFVPIPPQKENKMVQLRGKMADLFNDFVIKRPSVFYESRKEFIRICQSQKLLEQNLRTNNPLTDFPDEFLSIPKAKFDHLLGPF